MNKNTVMLFFAFSAGLLQAEVLIDQNFDNESGSVSVRGPLKRAACVRVESAPDTIGGTAAVHFNDESTSESGILEYCAGEKPAGAYMISFDVLNNAPSEEQASDRLIFSMGPWSDGKGYMLSGGAKRAFSVEFDQHGSSRAFNLRIGTTSVKKSSYDTSALQQVKIWVNDNDKKDLPYIRPDNQQEALLSPDSVVVWINNMPADDMLPGGVSMLSSVSSGDAVLGRLGFSCPSQAIVDFWIDNLHVESVSP